LFGDHFAARKFGDQNTNFLVIISQPDNLVIKTQLFGDQKNAHPHTLTLNCQSITQTDSKLIQQSEPFRLASNANRIINVTIKENYSSESIKLLVVLCPRMQHLTIDIFSLDLESIMRVILPETKTSIRDLCSIRTKNTTKLMDEILKRLIDSEELLENYLIDLAATHLYIWW